MPRKARPRLVLPFPAMTRHALALPLCLIALGGCLERRVSIMSDPPGATVFVNDVELGRTPVQADFTHYGTYDVRLELEGYEPLRTTARASTPIYEFPPVDLLTTAIPATFTNVVPWQFKLEPSAESTQPAEKVNADTIARARALRGL